MRPVPLDYGPNLIAKPASWILAFGISRGIGDISPPFGAVLSGIDSNLQNLF